MRHRLLATLVVLVALATAQQALAAPSPAGVFQALWERYDRPVAEQRTPRSWTWGPAPIAGPLEEDFSDPQVSPTTYQRTVIYYDKGRMEINNPNGDSSSPWYVTSGLLPIELMRGVRQNGISPDNITRWQESYISAIGDPDSFPAYPDLLTLYQSPGQIDPAKLGQPATELLDRTMTIGSYSGYVGDAATVLLAGPNGHGVPRAFLEFQRQQGLLASGGRLVSGQVYDPLFVFGLPVTPAVWVRATIGGKELPVLFQVFERRILTYNPANAPAFRVEMGNVGQHYHRWISSDPYASSEWLARPNGEPVTSHRPSDRVIYTLEQEQREEESATVVSYRLFVSEDGGATRELRASDTLRCRVAGVSLLIPRMPNSDPGHVGLWTQCSHAPSLSRGAGVTIKASYNAGRSFIVRGRM
ncbi:MAG TPA: hypothetical protein VFS21_07025 [Roseiflexaceae bacterium]|nr:hypothetical protein [Roseiflexaceae bacterium]